LETTPQRIRLRSARASPSSSRSAPGRSPARRVPPSRAPEQN
jgi:hypothetical protein